MWVLKHDMQYAMYFCDSKSHAYLLFSSKL